MSVPEQPSSPPSATRASASTVPPAQSLPPQARSEATRLLCAGVYFDGDFRRAVIEQLVEHEERPIAPSLGIDALPVLAHAVRARRQEIGTGLALLALWVTFVVLGITGTGSDPATAPIPWSLAYAVVCVLAWGVRGNKGSVFALGRSVLKEATRGRLKSVLPVLPVAAALGYWALALIALFGGADVWAAVVLPLLMVLPVWAHRQRVTALMRHGLSRQAFDRAPRERLPDTAQYRRIGQAIAREQYAGLAIYDPFRPFVGAGEPYKPWSFVVELQPGARKQLRPDAAGGGVATLTGRDVIDLIRPRLEDLRTSAAATSRDRLRSLEVDEMVYLPVGVARDLVDYDPDNVRHHREGAVGEGAEARRHFLRVRVGAWDEQIGISLLVRVHTQGGVLVLEVVPHVLTPVRPEYKSVDVLAERLDDGPLRDAVRALVTAPSAGFAAGVCLVTTAYSIGRTWLNIPEFAPPDGPDRSVRELGSAQEVSLFQEMDISRYVKTLQDRITGGVREALRVRGYETGEFEKYVINVGEGGVFIGQMSGGAVASGEGALAKQVDSRRSRTAAKSETGGGLR
ncbi:hypothetical protein [Streptomyces luteolus]|uniref:Integral membrane protein n=1 Tax=Streptomyces luteolus TaxID=3043615 RepID=A0ABT6SUL0_9ACTN|nr:hypothetical protein [Streptomyces sp. B-S-A12]MDI3419295.1 hypothetical protein [Streptomyces sp. B-S-A12]